MQLQTDPGHIHGLCKECNTVIKIPVTIAAVLEEQNGKLDLFAKVQSIDIQPMYDHQLMEHGPKLD